MTEICLGAVVRTVKIKKVRGKKIRTVKEVINK